MREVIDIQFGSCELLQDIPRLGIEDPKQCLIGKPWNLLSYTMNIVHSIAFG